MSVKTWDRGEYVRIDNSYTDVDEVAFDPDTVELKIYDPSGTLILQEFTTMIMVLPPMLRLVGGSQSGQEYPDRFQM